jgi:hypothetical protein
LNSIDFSWIGLGSRGDKTWEENFEDLLKCFEDIGTTKIPVKIDEKRNSSYKWFNNQKLEFRKGKLDEERMEKFKKAGIDLSLGRKDMWEESFDELMKHMDNGLLNIQHKIDGQINPIYNWLGRQRMLFKKGKLEQERIERLQNAGIDLSTVDRNTEKE